MEGNIIENGEIAEKRGWKRLRSDWEAEFRDSDVGKWTAVSGALFIISFVILLDLHTCMNLIKKNILSLQISPYSNDKQCIRIAFPFLIVLESRESKGELLIRKVWSLY